MDQVDLAKVFGGPEHVALMERIKRELVIIFLKRLGGKAEVSMAEMNDTLNQTVKMSLDTKTQVFHFEIGKLEGQ